jgi:hypothetical protein
VPKPPPRVRLKAGFPWGVVVETDDLFGLLEYRRTPPGPFLLISRDRGLALDTAFLTEGKSPILWPTHAQPHQLWNFQRTEHREQYLIVSVENGLALDARTDSEMSRRAVMWSPHGESHQRWRLHPTNDGTAFIIESVRTGHVLDAPWDAGPETRTPPVLYERHDAVNQQFLIVSPSSGPK